MDRAERRAKTDAEVTASVEAGIAEGASPVAMLMADQVFRHYAHTLDDLEFTECSPDDAIREVSGFLINCVTTLVLRLVPRNDLGQAVELSQDVVNRLANGLSQSIPFHFVQGPSKESQ